MARTGRPSAENVNFADRDEARRWFGGQSREVCVALAARAALRALPLIWRARDVSDFPARVALPVFRAGFVARAVAEYPRSRARLRAASAAYAAAAAADAAYAAYAAACAAKADAIAVEQKRPLPEIVTAPLWPSEPPQAFVEAWDRFQDWMLQDEASQWYAWPIWYNRVRHGGSFGEEFTLAVAALADDAWDERPCPAGVNKRIASLFAEHVRIETPSEEAPEPIPAQGAGPHFALNPDIKIGLAPARDFDAVGNNFARIGNLLPTVRQAASDLAGHINPNSQPEISRVLGDYRESIAGEPTAIAWGTVFGIGVRLENAASAARRQIEDRLQPPLEDAAQEALDTVLTLHGPLILATKEGRELSEQADEFRATREEQAALRQAARTVAAALKNSNLADPAAADIAEAAAETIGEGRHPERGSVFGLSTIKNVATLLVPAGVVGAAHAAVDHLVGGGAAGLAAGAAAAGFAGFGFAEVEQIRGAARALGGDIVRLVDAAKDQAALARA
jgi:hypothetical protein